MSASGLSARFASAGLSARRGLSARDCVGARHVCRRVLPVPV